MSGYIDSHSHLADSRYDSPDEVYRTEILLSAKNKNINYHLQGGVGPEDWKKQKELLKKFPQIWPVFGLHPYWVADHSELECEEALDLLAKEIILAYALGETGLDLRPHIMKDSFDRQMGCFEKQLEISSLSGKPVVLHIVQAFEEALGVLHLWGVPAKGGMIHSFNGSAAEAEKYLELGLHVSIGGPAARENKTKLHQAIRIIPLDRLLIETDSPDQPPDRLKGQLNNPSSLWDVAQVVGQIKNKSPEEILDISSLNLRKLLSI